MCLLFMTKVAGYSGLSTRVQYIVLNDSELYSIATVNPINRGVNFKSGTVIVSVGTKLWR